MEKIKLSKSHSIHKNQLFCLIPPALTKRKTRTCRFPSPLKLNQSRKIASKGTLYNLPQTNKNTSGSSWGIKSRNRSKSLRKISFSMGFTFCMKWPGRSRPNFNRFSAVKTAESFITLWGLLTLSSKSKYSTPQSRTRTGWISGIRSATECSEPFMK